MTENAAPEPEPSVEPEAKTVDDISAEELAAAIDERAQTPGADPTEEPEPPAPEPEVAAQPEPAEEPAPEPEGEPAPPDPLSEIDDLKTRFEQVELQRQAQEERTKHLEFLLSRKAGEAGDLQQKLRAMSQPTPQPAPTDDYGEELVAPQPPAVEAALGDDVRRDLSEMRKERVASAADRELQAVQNENQKFWAQVQQMPEETQAEFQKTFQEKLAAESRRYDDAVSVATERGDVKMITSVVRAAYGASLADARAEFAKRFRGARTADSPATRQRKLDAAAGSTGTRPVPRVAPKKLDDLSPEEMQREIDRRAAAGIFVE